MSVKLLAKLLNAGALLGVFFTAEAGAQALNATKTNLVNKDHKFASAIECGECHQRQYNQWSGSMMRYSSISPPIHTLERAENEFNPPAIMPFAFDVKGGLTAAEFGHPGMVDFPEGRFAKGPTTETPDGNRVENNLFCQKCHAPVAVLADVFPDWDKYGGLEIDSHQVLRILSKDPNFFDIRPTQAQVDAKLADNTVEDVSGDDAVRQRNARIATEGVTCTVCHRMNGRNTDNTFANRRPNFEPGVANSAYLFEGFVGSTSSPMFLPVFGAYNQASSGLGASNGFLDLVSAPHGAFATELNANPIDISQGALVGNDGVTRSFLSSGEMCGTCHDVRIPLPDVLITDANGKSEAFRRVENLFTEWRNSPWNNNNNAPDPGGLVITDNTQLDNAIANPRGPARDVTSLAAINDPGNLKAGNLVGKQDVAGNPIKQITTCQDCHMSRFMTNTAALPGEYPKGTIASFGAMRKVTDHRFIGVDRILVDQAEFGGEWNDSIKSSNNFQDIGLADISDLSNTGLDPNGFNYGDISPGVADAREILLAKAVDFKILSGTVEGPPSDRVLPLRISVENVGAGHNIPAGLSQERQVWIELQVLEPLRNSAGDMLVSGGEIQYQNVYTSGYLVKKPGDFNPVGAALYEDNQCFQPNKEYECNLDDIYVVLDGRMDIEGRLEKRDLMGVDDAGDPGVHDEPGDYNLRQADPEIHLLQPKNLGLINYQNGFTRGMDSPSEGLGSPILQSGNNERRRDKVFSQFISDTIDNGNALRPFEKRIEKYDVPVTGREGPFLVKARLRFRPLPPEFLENLKKNPGSRITDDVIKRNKVIEMAGDSCLAGDPDGFASSPRCSPIATVAPGQVHTCASVDGDTVQCWGAGGLGTLGDGNQTNHNVSFAQNVLDLQGVQTVAAGSYHTCALLLDGTVECWGQGQSGQLGNARSLNSAVPVQAQVTDVAELVLGGNHSCAILDNRQVVCWGSNVNQQLGLDASTPHLNTPVVITGLKNERGEENTIALAAGTDHTCALSDMGEVRCWGAGSWGRLGDGSASAHNTATPARVKGLLYRATAIAAGSSHTCALMEDGNVKCWGSGKRGKLGNGSLANVDVAKASGDVIGVPGNAIDIAVGIDYSCALLDESTATTQRQRVKCWGAGYALGVGDINTDRGEAVYIDHGNDVATVTAGNYHACIVKYDGTSECWGLNSTSQIGNGSTALFVDTPSTVLMVPTTTYMATNSLGGNSVGACTAEHEWQINCTDEGDWMDLNEETGFKWIIAGGTGGNIRLSIKGAALSGTRSMSLWVNGGKVGVVTVESSWAPRGVGAEVHLPATLQPGDNIVELRDTENKMELDIYHLRVSRH